MKHVTPDISTPDVSVEIGKPLKEARNGNRDMAGWPASKDSRIVIGVSQRVAHGMVSAWWNRKRELSKIAYSNVASWRLNNEPAPRMIPPTVPKAQANGTQMISVARSNGTTKGKRNQPQHWSQQAGIRSFSSGSVMSPRLHERLRDRKSPGQCVAKPAHACSQVFRVLEFGQWVRNI